MRVTSWRAAIGLAAAACLALQAGQACKAPPSDEKPRPAPDIVLEKLNDTGRLSLADYRGAVVLVDLWATWCAPCLAELPHLQGLADSFDPTEFLMLGIVLESGDRQDIEEFLREQGITYPNVLGEDGTKEAFGTFLGYPTKYLIDKEGYIIKKYFGLVGDRLREDVERFVRTGSLEPSD